MTSSAVCVRAKPDWTVTTVTSQSSAWAVVNGEGWTVRAGFQTNEEAWAG